MIHQHLVEEGYLRKIPRHELPGGNNGDPEKGFRSWQLECHDQGRYFYEFVPNPPREVATAEQQANVIELAGHMATKKAAEAA